MGADRATVRVKDPDGRPIGTVEVPLTDGHGTAKMPIDRPRLWEPADPALYTADFGLALGLRYRALLAEPVAVPSGEVGEVIVARIEGQQLLHHGGRASTSS